MNAPKLAWQYVLTAIVIVTAVGLMPILSPRADSATLHRFRHLGSEELNNNFRVTLIQDTATGRCYASVVDRWSTYGASAAGGGLIEVPCTANR